MIFILVGLIKTKGRAKKNIIRAGKGLPIHMTHSSSKWKVRDARLKNAMEHMKCDKPWTVQKFIDEVSTPDWDPTFETIDQGTIFFHLVLERVLQDQENNV